MINILLIIPGRIQKEVVDSELDCLNQKVHKFSRKMARLQKKRVQESKRKREQWFAEEHHTEALFRITCK
jgi:hypothetical protein